MNNRRSFIIGIKSTKLNLREKNFLRKYKPWGVILFTRNIKDIKQAKQLTTQYIPSQLKKIIRGM